MTGNPNVPSAASPNAGGTPGPTERVTLVSISEPKSTETGKAYVEAHFKRGLFGRPIRRSFWGTADANGFITWERADPAQLKALVGRDLTGEAFVEAVDIEPKEITITATGEVRTLTSATIIRFADETLEQALRSYGMTPRKPKAEVQVVPQVPPGFVLATNGHAEG